MSTVDRDAKLLALRVLLDTLVATKQLMPYSRAAAIVGVHHRSPEFFTLLGQVIREDAAQQKPLRSSVIINKTTGMPGNAYFEMAHSAATYSLPMDDRQLWKSQLESLGY